jgi:hypothetical protein
VGGLPLVFQFHTEKSIKEAKTYKGKDPLTLEECIFGKGQPVRNDDLKIVCSDDFNLGLLK